MSAARRSSASSMRAPAFNSSARSRVKTVTSSALGCENIDSDKRAPTRSRAAETVSIGTRPRYSMRLATSAAVGAEIEPLTNSPLWVSARYWKLGMSASDRSHAQHFRRRGYAGATFGDSVVDHRGHASLDRGGVDHLRIGMPGDQVADRAGHFDDLENAAASAIAGAAAAVAAVRLKHRVIRPKAERGEARIGIDALEVKLLARLATVAKGAHQPLRDRRAQRRFQKKPFDPEVKQARQRRGRGFGVQRRQHQMPRKRGMDRDVGGLGVAYLADHDHVGILTHEGAQGRGEGEPDRRLDLRLVD